MRLLRWTTAALLCLVAACGEPATQGECTPDCEARSCGDDGCGGTCGSCRPWQTCPGTACILDPASTWDLVADRGSVSSGTWDGLGGAPDPYVCAAMDGARVCTGPIADTSIPMWHQTLFTKVRADTLKAGFFVQYYDADGATDDTICYGDIEVHTSDFSAGYFDAVCNGDSSDVVFNLVYDP